VGGAAEAGAVTPKSSATRAMTTAAAELRPRRLGRGWADMAEH
jgi:hypothetical protein